MEFLVFSDLPSPELSRDIIRLTEQTADRF